MTEHRRQLLALSAQIVAAHARHNEVRIDMLPHLIENIYNTLEALSPGGSLVSNGSHYAQTEHRHAEYPDSGRVHSHADNVYVHPEYGQTVFGDHLICMEDGLSMKMLKRHLQTVHDMTPEEYRVKWDLPESYPMVASEYATLRSKLALQSGLGLKPQDRPVKRRSGR